MSGFKLLISFLIIILVVFAFTYRNQEITGNSIVYSGLLTSEKITRYNMNAEVMNADNTSIGIVVEDRLDFGRMPAGSDVRKTLTLNNDESWPVKITITPTGNISRYVSVSRNDFMLDGAENIEVVFRSADTGNFTGTLDVTAIKPRNWLAGWFLQWT